MKETKYMHHYVPTTNSPLKPFNDIAISNEEILSCVQTHHISFKRLGHMETGSEICAMGLFMERKACWENGGDYEISIPRSFEFARLCNAYFPNKILSLSTNKNISYAYRKELLRLRRLRNSNMFVDLPMSSFPTQLKVSTKVSLQIQRFPKNKRNPFTADFFIQLLMTDIFSPFH